MNIVFFVCVWKYIWKALQREKLEYSRVSPFNGLWTQQWSWILSQRFMCRTWNKNKIDFKRFFKAIISERKHITPEGMSLVMATCLVCMRSNIPHCLSQFWFHIILTFKGNQNTRPSFWVVWYHHSVCAPAPHTNRSGCRSLRRKQRVLAAQVLNKDMSAPVLHNLFLRARTVFHFPCLTTYVKITVIFQ